MSNGKARRTGKSIISAPRKPNRPKKAMGFYGPAVASQGQRRPTGRQGHLAGQLAGARARPSGGDPSDVMLTRADNQPIDLAKEKDKDSTEPTSLSRFWTIEIKRPRRPRNRAAEISHAHRTR